MDDPVRLAAKSDGRSRIVWLLRPVAVVGGLLLAALMILIAADVALRYLANAPLFGAHEITELLMVALVMLAIPYCAATGGHIRVEVFDHVLGRWGRTLGDMLSAMIGLAVLGFLIWRALDKAFEAYTYSDRTNLLSLPIWPIYLLIAAGMLGYAFVIARDLVNRLRGPEHVG